MIEAILQYDFMLYALLGVLLVAPLFSILGTVVVETRLAFFSDALGHSALTGVALGVILGLESPLISMCVFAAVFSMLLNRIRRSRVSGSDTVISVFSSTAIALGLVLLAADGSFAKYSGYLIGDILTIAPPELVVMAVLLLLVMVFWMVFYNKLMIMGLSEPLASSRGIRTGLIDNAFILILAMAVTFSIRWIGILLINSLLILPSAAARNVARHARGYLLLSVLFSLASGLGGLAISYYANITTGPMIVLLSAAIFFVTIPLRKLIKN